ncbi:unnamed protein product [Parnassius mnemosyne]|uniref:PH domain-containing protein n=1 Tax=Parnassius mnemosyne TaxID=213953 RepID=A0AAV1LMH2_9NEOP
MSGLQTRSEDTINGVDVREQGSALRVATNTPHLVSLGTGRLSTAVTLHPIKQGRVTIGSDPTCDIYVVGTGVASVHCRVENSHGVVTLYPVSGSTLLDGLPVDKATRLSQGDMLTIGRSNYLRFNHPEEAKLMKSVLPSGHVSMAPIQFQPNEQCLPAGYVNHNTETTQCYQTANIQKIYKDTSLSQLDQELDMTLREMSRKKPPVAPKKPYRDLDQSDSNSDQESRPKMSGIMAKVSKFEYYAKQQKCVGRSQFYTTNENEISPKVFSANSLTVNTPAKDVLGGKAMPNYMTKFKHEQKMIVLNENNSIDARNCSYANVAVRNKTKIDDIVRNFDESRNEFNKLPKKINNDQMKTENVYGRINIKETNCEMKNNVEVKQSNLEHRGEVLEPSREHGNERSKGIGLPSSAYDRNPQYSPVYANYQYDRGLEAENMRKKAYQDRIKEEQQKEAETARLEEILNMCAEYERQIATGNPITPTEKRSHNKIITNGSLPRSVAHNNPNIIQTSEGYYKFDTSHSRSTPINSLKRNLSSYENYDLPQSPTQIEQLTPEVTIGQNYENVGRMDEIGIPVFDDEMSEMSSPILLRKNGDRVHLSASPIGSPYENVYYKNNAYGNFKPKSPNTQSPRTRIKTSLAHKNLTSPQYFIFPTPPPKDNNKQPDFSQEVARSPRDNAVVDENNTKDPKCVGIEKQLSLEEEIPMIDDADLTNDLEFRYSRDFTDKQKEQEDKSNQQKEEPKDFTAVEVEVHVEKVLSKNLSFDDVKKELMADIPELEEFEKDLKQNKRQNIIRHITEDMKKMDIEASSIDSAVLDDNVDDLKSKYESLKEERKKLVAQIHEIKCKMSEIRSQEDDILRELEMEKALIKGEYDSEIAILNIEQRKKAELTESARRIEEEIKQMKEKQEIRQNEMRDRVEIATTKVKRLEKDLKDNAATLEELQNAQDILDNETKIFEDLEFQHLEEESELLANREDIQNEIINLTKKIEAQKSRILNLKSEANNNLTSALDETKVLQAEYVRLLNQVEVLTGKVQNIEKELKPIANKLNDAERTQSPDSAFYTDQTRAKSGEFDRISKVTIDAPILSSDTDMNSLGKRTLDSLMEIERKRIEMLEEQGCQVIENEREKISELKRRAQDETKKLWDQKNRMEQAKSVDSDTYLVSGEFNNSNVANDVDKPTDRTYGNMVDDSMADDAFNLTSSTIYEESSGFLSSSIEELQVRNSRTESTEDDKRSDDSRPLSHASDFSRDNILSLSSAPRRSRRGVFAECSRPLTRYLPVDTDDFDLRTHVESAGHQIELCPYVIIDSTSCRGYLHKLGAKFHTWSKRWFVFDRESKTFVYYWDKSEKKPRGGAYFQVIEEVYLDHGNTSKSPNPQTTFIVKTRQRRYFLMAPSGEAARIWIDVVFTGAQGYTEYLE